MIRFCLTQKTCFRYLSLVVLSVKRPSPFSYIPEGDWIRVQEGAVEPFIARAAA